MILFAGILACLVPTVSRIYCARAYLCAKCTVLRGERHAQFGHRSELGSVLYYLDG